MAATTQPPGETRPAGREAGYRYVLQVLSLDPVPARRIYLRPGSYLVGARPEADIFLPVPGVSRRHARLSVPDDGEARISDLGSKNGTFIGSRRIQDATAGDGALLRFGPVEAQLLAADAALSTIAIGAPTSGRASATAQVQPEDDRSTEKVTLAEMLLSVVAQALGPGASPASAGAAAVELAHGWLSLGRLERLELVRAPAAGDEAVVVALGQPLEEIGHEPDLEVAGAGGWRARLWLPPAAVAARVRPVVAVALRLLAQGPELGPAAPLSAPCAHPAVEIPAPGSLCDAVIEVYRQAGKVAGSDLPVLVLGESGTGKEVLARWLHASSRRREGPFRATNCAAFPRELLEAELFGIERGVATGVEARPGILEQARGGTVFLDEVGDMAPETQAKVLRALEDTTLLRVGGRNPIPVDVRFVASTNYPLDRLVEEGRFRRDLYYRLAGLVASLPPLRKRRADIPLLAAHFYHRELERSGHRSPGITRGALGALVSHNWPGNVRELENEITKGVLLLEPQEPLDLGHLSPAVQRAAAPAGAGVPLTLARALRRAELETFQVALSAAAGNASHAMQLLGLPRTTFYRKLKELGLADPTRVTS